jgi:hypothetical protein
MDQVTLDEERRLLRSTIVTEPFQEPRIRDVRDLPIDMDLEQHALIQVELLVTVHHPEARIQVAKSDDDVAERWDDDRVLDGSNDSAEVREGSSSPLSVCAQSVLAVHARIGC